MSWITSDLIKKQDFALAHFQKTREFNTAICKWFQEPTADQMFIYISSHTLWKNTVNATRKNYTTKAMGIGMVLKAEEIAIDATIATTEIIQKVTEA